MLSAIWIIYSQPSFEKFKLTNEVLFQLFIRERLNILWHLSECSLFSSKEPLYKTIVCMYEAFLSYDPELKLLSGYLICNGREI